MTYTNRGMKDIVYEGKRNGVTQFERMMVSPKVFLLLIMVLVLDTSRTTATSKMGISVTIVSGFQSLNNVTENSILDVTVVLDTPFNSNTFFTLLFKIYKMSLFQLFFQCQAEF